jgi:uncharacterized protein DUF955
MVSSRVERIAGAFWNRAGGRPDWGAPVDIATAAATALPASVVPIRGLNTAAVQAFLARIGASVWFDSSPRALRGCIVADVGYALIFVDADDSDEERRFTVAHEIAHFLVHYLVPREEAVRVLGPGIAAVLDRIRPATYGERFSSALRNVPITPFGHAMDRADRRAARIARMEDEADDLGIELIAPWRELQAMDILSPEAVRARFGVPHQVAARLASMVSPSRTAMGVLGIFGRK